MTLSPASSVGPSSVTIAGTVDVSDRANRVLGRVVVTDVLTQVSVIGPLTNAELRAIAVDVALGSTVSVATVPGFPLEVTDATSEASLATIETALGDLATEDTLDAVRDAVNDVALTAILEREKIEP